MEYYEESLSTCRSVLDADCETMELATVLNITGRIHYLKDDHDKSLEVYRLVLGIRRRILGGDHINVAAI